MNIKNLSEEESGKIKKQLTDASFIVTKNKISAYDEKFFDVVTADRFIVKFCLFFGIGLYVLLNVLGIVLSIRYNTFNAVSIVAPAIVCAVVIIISLSIFKNVNTDKKSEKNVMYIVGGNFVFNFNNGVVETPNLFYSLPCDSLLKIEFVIHRLIKAQLYGSVTFTFAVSGCEVTHTIPTANLSQIEDVLKAKFPELLSLLIVDGKNNKNETVIKNANGKYLALSFGLAVIGVLLFVAPYIFSVNFVSLRVFGVLFFVSALAVLLSPFLYVKHFVQGMILSLAFMAIGYLLPLILIENSGIAFLQYLAGNVLVLLPTFFGNIGLCLYLSTLFHLFGKIVYKIKSKKRNY